MPTHESEDARKQQILKAAFSCFSLRGFDNVTMDEVAREANLSKGAVYWYFKSKDDLIAALCESWCNQNHQTLSHMAAERPLEQLMHDFPSFIFTDSGVKEQYKIFFQLWARSTENAELRQRLAAMYAELCQVGSDLIRTAIDREILKPSIDPDGLSRMLASTFDGLLIQWHFNPNLDLVAAWRRFVDYLFEGIRVGTATNRTNQS
jgi:AcrR family transcriptional regulator